MEHRSCYHFQFWSGLLTYLTAVFAFPGPGEQDGVSALAKELKRLLLALLPQFLLIGMDCS